MPCMHLADAFIQSDLYCMEGIQHLNSLFELQDYRKVFDQWHDLSCQGKVYHIYEGGSLSAYVQQR